MSGERFTWERSKGTSRWARERLDRAFANEDWWQLFPLCKLPVFHTICSDHDPIKLDLYDVKVTKKQLRFKFENTWLREPNFHHEVRSHWEGLPSINLLPKLLDVSSFMARWGRNFFHKFKGKIAKQKAMLEMLAGKDDDESIH